jgi:hypothetical protein
VRERGDRLQIAVQQLALVQTADGSITHEEFQIPHWLTDAVRASAGVGVVRVQHEALPGPSGGDDAPNGHGAPGNGAAAAIEAPTEPAALPAPAKDAVPPANGASKPGRTVLRFYMHESDDGAADTQRLDDLITLISEYPGEDSVRLFIHANDGDRIELSMPDARACDELREAGVRLLGEGGGAEEIRRPGAGRTAGVQALEV